MFIIIIIIIVIIINFIVVIIIIIIIFKGYHLCEFIQIQGKLYDLFPIIYL